MITLDSTQQTQRDAISPSVLFPKGLKTMKTATCNHQNSHHTTPKQQLYTCCMRNKNKISIL